MNYLQKLLQVPVIMSSVTKQLTTYRLMTLLVLYKSYGMYQIMHKEQMCMFKELCGDGIKNNLLTDSGVIVENFKPSYFILSGVAQTLYCGVATAHPPPYKKEFLKLPDGGQLALQSIVNPVITKGVVVIIPGICGDGFDAYIVNTVNKAIENDYSVYVVNHRGLCDTKLLTPLTYHGGSSFDTKAAIDHIQAKHPNQPLFGISFSLGSNIMGRYLGEEGEQSKLAGAVCISCPFNSLEASSHSEKTCFGLISRYLAWNAKRTLTVHEHLFPQFKEVHDLDLSEIFKTVVKFKDFDDKVTARMFGYNSYIDYYTKCSVVSVMKNIKTKTLFISALDDPFYGPDVLPIEEFNNNENIYLMATSGGGHVGFFDSILCKEQWFNKPVFKFIDHLNTFNKV